MPRAIVQLVAISELVAIVEQIVAGRLAKNDWLRINDWRFTTTDVQLLTFFRGDLGLKRRRIERTEAGIHCAIVRRLTVREKMPKVESSEESIVALVRRMVR